MSAAQELPAYEDYGSKSGTAVVCIAFSVSIVFMLLVERVVSALTLLAARLIWGPESCPNSCCIEEPMATLAEGLAAKFPGSSALRDYLALLAASEEQSQRGSALNGYASIQASVSILGMHRKHCVYFGGA
jgi:hypothetical protein